MLSCLNFFCWMWVMEWIWFLLVEYLFLGRDKGLRVQNMIGRSIMKIITLGKMLLRNRTCWLKITVGWLRYLWLMIGLYRICVQIQLNFTVLRRKIFHLKLIALNPGLLIGVRLSNHRIIKLLIILVKISTLLLLLQINFIWLFCPHFWFFIIIQI